jgi:hypothetical protein
VAARAEIRLRSESRGQRSEIRQAACTSAPVDAKRAGSPRYSSDVPLSS